MKYQYPAGAHFIIHPTDRELAINGSIKKIHDDLVYLRRVNSQILEHPNPKDIKIPVATKISIKTIRDAYRKIYFNMDINRKERIVNMPKIYQSIDTITEGNYYQFCKFLFHIADFMNDGVFDPEYNDIVEECLSVIDHDYGE